MANTLTHDCVGVQWVEFEKSKLCSTYDSVEIKNDLVHCKSIKKNLHILGLININLIAKIYKTKDPTARTQVAMLYMYARTQFHSTAY